MSAKHTPGPWRIAELHALGLFDNEGSAKVLAGVGDDSVAIASVAAHAPMKRGQGSNLADPERDANAHLIAAATDLLTAAKEMDRWMLVIESAMRADAPRDHGAVLDALKANAAAIAKATGQ